MPLSKRVLTWRKGAYKKAAVVQQVQIEDSVKPTDDLMDLSAEEQGGGCEQGKSDLPADELMTAVSALEPADDTELLSNTPISKATGVFTLTFYNCYFACACLLQFT